MVDVRNFLAWAVLAVGTNAAAIGQVRPGATEALFSVRDIPVDATAQAAAQARERALAVGQRQAFERLVARLTQPDDGARLGAIDDDAIQALVLGIELSDERTSPVRYLAKLTVRFQPGAIRQRLAAAGIPMVETLSAPLLVLPVYATADTVVLWDDPNPWREAWNAAPAADGLVPLLFPVGDLADMEDVGPEHAVAGDGDRLRRIAQRYGAGDAIVVEARLAEAGEENADRHLHITATRHGSVPTTEVKETFVVPANRALDDALRVAVAWVRGEFEKNWKRENLVVSGAEQRLAVVAPFKDLAEWLEMRRRLSAVSVLRRSTLMTLSPQAATLELGFVGNAQQLRNGLAQRQLMLDGGDGDWTLSLAGGAATRP